MKVSHLAIMGAVALALSACGVHTPNPEQGEALKTWAGSYRLDWLPETQVAKREQIGPEVQIRPLVPSDTDISGIDLNLHRWVIAINNEEGEPLPLKPFRAADYEGFSLINAPASTPLECLEGGAIFICRTQPNTTVAFDVRAQEKLRTTTDFFGVALHQGSFELTPLD